MSKDFNVNLNGTRYAEVNIPNEIQLKGKEDALSIFDKNKDGKLSKAELKDAILELVNEEKKVSGQYSDGTISDQEAVEIAKTFKNGKFKIGENIQKLIKEFQGRMADNDSGYTKKYFEETTTSSSHFGSITMGDTWTLYINNEDGTVVDANGQPVEGFVYDSVNDRILKEGTTVINSDKAQKKKYLTDGKREISMQALNYKGQPYKKEYSAKLLDLTKEPDGMYSKMNKPIYRAFEYGVLRPRQKSQRFDIKDLYQWDGNQFVYVKSEELPTKDIK